MTNTLAYYDYELSIPVYVSSDKTSNFKLFNLYLTFESKFIKHFYVIDKW